MSSEAPDNPFRGPRPFERDDAGSFFGREREATELSALIASRRCVFLYAQSGAGKSSLINAAIIPALEAREFLVLPVARVSGTAESSDVDNIYVHNAVSCWHPDRSAEALAELTIEEAIADFRARAPRRGCVVIFDQFEELTTHYPHRWTERTGLFEQIAATLGVGRGVLRDHAELLRDLGPQGWARPEAEEALEELDAHDPGLSERLRGASADEVETLLRPYLQWTEPRDLRFVFVLREDYLARVESYSSGLGSDLRARQRLDPLRQDQARLAIRKPFANAERPLSDAAVELLVTRLAAVRIQAPGQLGTSPAGLPAGEFVEPTHLQIACASLWRDSAGDPTPLSAERVAQIDPVGHGLGRFYEDALLAATGTGLVKEMALRSWIESELLTQANTRGTVFHGEEDSGGLPNPVLEALDAAGLVRPEARAGARWYELTHDALISPILRSNRAAEQAHARRRNRSALAVVVVLGVVIATGWVGALWLRNSADEEIESARVKAGQSRFEKVLLQVDNLWLATTNDITTSRIEEKKEELQVQLTRTGDALTSTLGELGLERLERCPTEVRCTDEEQAKAADRWEAGNRERKQDNNLMAIALYNEGRQACPSSPDCYHGLGWMMERVGGELDQVRFESARKYYECALELDPSRKQTQEALAQLLKHWATVAPPEQVDPALEAALDYLPKPTSPKGTRPDPSVVSQATWRRGDQALQKGDKEEAEDLYEEALAHDSRNPRPWSSLGRMAASAGDLTKAERMFRRAIQVDPSYPSPYFDLVIVHQKQGDLAKANKALKIASARFPDYEPRKQARLKASLGLDPAR